MILYVLVLRTLLKKILLALPGVPIKAEFITRYKIQECGNIRLNTSFFMKFYKTCDLIWNLNGFC